MSSPEGKNGFTKWFAKVFLNELEYIEQRRKDLGINSKSVTNEHERLSKLIEEESKSDVSDPNRVARQTEIRPSAKAELVGLAFSGGGIRSATFNLGVLQGLARRGVLRCCDYLSTVSGGGYIGSCLSSLLEDSGPRSTRRSFRFAFNAMSNRMNGTQRSICVSTATFLRLKGASSITPA